MAARTRWTFRNHSSTATGRNATRANATSRSTAPKPQQAGQEQPGPCPAERLGRKQPAPSAGRVAAELQYAYGVTDVAAGVVQRRAAEQSLAGQPVRVLVLRSRPTVDRNDEQEGSPPIAARTSNVGGGGRRSPRTATGFDRVLRTACTAELELQPRRGPNPARRNRGPRRGSPPTGPRSGPSRPLARPRRRDDRAGSRSSVIPAIFHSTCSVTSANSGTIETSGGRPPMIPRPGGPDGETNSTRRRESPRRRSRSQPSRDRA